MSARTKILKVILDLEEIEESLRSTDESEDIRSAIKILGSRTFVSDTWD